MEKYCKSCGRVFDDLNFKLCPYCGSELATRYGRQPIPRQLRHEVFKRDGYRCRECGASKEETSLEIDHIVPVARGGTNDIDNLQTLCRECNRMKHTDEWVGGETNLETVKQELNSLKNQIKKVKNDLSQSNNTNELNKISDKKKQSEKKKETLQDRINRELSTDDNLEIPCPVCGKMIKTKTIICKYCKTNLTGYKTTYEFQEAIKEQIIKSTRDIGFDEQATIYDLKSNENDLDTEDEKAFNNLFNVGETKLKENLTNKIHEEEITVEEVVDTNIDSLTDNDEKTVSETTSINEKSYEESEPWYYTVSPSDSINTKPKQVKAKSRVSKLSTQPTKKNEHKSKLTSKPKYQNYKLQINKLQSNFKMKEKNTRNLIEKCFPSPQMTNTKFNQIIDECSKIFSLKMKSIMIIIDSSNEYSLKLENEIKSDIDDLKQIINKLDSLHDELLIQMSESDDVDFENLLEEMDQLITSVKEYEFDNK